MVPKIYDLIELAITWLERFPMGRNVISFLLALGTSVWGWFSYQPPILIWVQFWTVFTAASILFLVWIPEIRRRIQLPLEIEVKGYKGSEGGCELPIFFLNRSNKPMSLQLQVVLHPYPVETPNGTVDGARIIGQQTMTINNIKLNLGPLEDTQGTVLIPCAIPFPVGDDGVFRLRMDVLLVDDRLSRRKRRCQIPGQTSWTISEHGASY